MQTTVVREEVGGSGRTPQRLRVLIVESSDTDATMVVRELQRSGRTIDFERVDTSSSMRAALEREWDVVIADLAVGDLGGIAALSVLRELKLDLPFIIISATSGEEHAFDAFRAGAGDYIL